MSRWVNTWFVVFVACAVPAAQAPEQAWRLDPRRYMADVRFLASDELAGRGNGHAGLDRAADYIADEFSKAGLSPGSPDGTFFQSFEVNARVEADARNPFVVTGPGGEVRFRLGTHFYPMSIVDRTADEASGPRSDASGARSRVVFAGYGISAPALGYDDYAGIDVTGAAVIVFTHEPQENVADSVFDGTALTPHADVARKAAVAMNRGARLLVVIEDPSHTVDRAVVPGWSNDPQIGEMGIPVVRVDRARLARALGGIDFTAEARAIDRTLAPRSRALPLAAVTYVEQASQVRARVRNVIGVLPGADAARRGEAVVIGAHYDHVGFGGRYSMSASSTGEIHNGADDNASGTAAVIEMARAAAADRERFGRTVVFVAFAGEEIGLLGSAAYVARPAVPLRSTVAMLNLDMIGRAHGRVLIGGRGRDARLARAVRDVESRTRLRVDDFSKGGYEDGGSDDASFVRAGVPALAFFTGFHGDYHRPGDDWQRIDAEGATDVARLALNIVEILSRN